MPIIIDTTTKAPEYKPKFFSDLLTGNGRNMGLLNSTLNHANDRFAVGVKANVDKTDNIRIKACRTTNSTTEYHHIPFTNIVTRNTQELYYFTQIILSYETTKDAFAVYKDKDTVYYAIPVNALYSKSLNKKNEKNFKIRYLSVKEVNGTLTTDLKIVDSPFYILGVHGVDDPAKQEDYSVYQAVTKMSELMQVHFPEITTRYVDLLAQHKHKNVFASLLRLTDFNLTFEHYSELFDSIKRWLQADIPEDETRTLQAIVLSNTSLLMLDSVHSLIGNKNKHAHTTAPAQPPQLADFLSPAQLEAAITNEPFVLVQAGAGTGKSTTIIERIKYMEAAGVDPQDIRVLSLTNAAADNILQKNNRIQSMTIAKYIATIYKLNYPDQELVDYQTLKNTIMIYAGHMPNARTFRNLISKDDSMELLVFIRDNFDEVVEILNLAGQTTLHIQSYICYLQAEKLNYGDDNAHHFIVDETQDNNIFEFIYLMKIAALRKASLYIVGDASQTLYEFRGASSQALNAIETSGVFECIKLDINYRSNQYILDFANRTLAEIDVNRFAQIQLQADEFKDMTKDELKRTVTVEPLRVNNMKEFEENAMGLLTLKAEPYVRQRLEKGEKVTLIARRGADVQKLQAWAERVFPKYKTTNLVPKRPYASTLFSSYVQKAWTELVMTPKSDVLKVVTQDIEDKLTSIYGSGRVLTMRKPSINQINAWAKENKDLVLRLQSAFRAGRLSHKDMMNNIRDNLIQYEVRNNAIRKSLLKQEQDQADKERMIEESDILISTVHSVKGLEFDNVVYLHRDSKAENEEEKRIDYVALTRAKKTELVIDIFTRSNDSKLGHYFANLLERYK